MGENYPNISHGCWDEGAGDNLAFLQWRCLIARACGVGTEFVEFGEVHREVPKLPYEELSLDNVLGDWRTTPVPELLILLAHSDEEGHLHPDNCDLVAEALSELLPDLHRHSHHANGSVLQKAEVARTKQFIGGLVLASRNNESVTFE